MPATSAKPEATSSPAGGESLHDGYTFATPKTIFIIVELGVAIRDVLRSDAYKVLRACRNLRIVIFSRVLDDEFRKEFGGESVFFEPLQKWRAGPLVKMLRSLHKDVWNEKHELIRFRERRSTRKKRFGRDLALKLILRGGSKERINRMAALFSRWEKKFTPSLASEYFEKYQPDLVFYTTLYSSNHAVEIAAEQRGVKSVGFVLSWDNPTTKGPFLVRPHRVILWNEIMRDELLKFHDFSPEQLFVSGPPQFDVYADHSAYSTRDEFFRKWKLDPAKKLITYTTGTPGTAPLDHEVVELLYERMKSGAFAQECQMLIRLHPKDEHNVYERFRNKPDLVLQLPGRRSATVDRWNPTREEMYGLAETMLYSDVVVNIASTITLDAACFDTPVVNVAFDGYQDLPYEQSCRRYYEFDHYKKVVETGGLKISYSIGELVEHIQHYLNDPSLDRAGRARIREEQCYKLDGQAGQRIGEYLVECLASPNPALAR